MSAEDELLMILMKLRLASDFKDLAVRFDIGEKTIGQVFHEGIRVLACMLKPLVTWPNKEVLVANMPKLFKKHFPKVKLIVDCTEVFTERPTSLYAQGQMWSTYKHHCTLKFLVAITPNGHICYVSDSWGGRAGDKEITLDAPLEKFLEHGDEVMADRGFTVAQELACMGVGLRTPAHTKGKKQLSQRDTELSRELSRVRIHVERVIGRMKVYKLLRSRIPITLMRDVDDIVTVVAALCNMQPSVM